MLDIAYLFLTLSFFALMLLYVRACARLGATRESGESERTA